jgi:drug/metabolite transporter (DMT)-like permease
METGLALTIIGSVLSVVGVLFFLFPAAVNEKVMEELSESAVRPAAALRSVLGGSALMTGILALCCRSFPQDEASMLLTAYGVGMSVMLTSILLIKPRKFTNEIPLPPVIMFVVLIGIAFYSA